MAALMIGAASTSETSVNFYQTTWRNSPKDSQLHKIPSLLKPVNRKYAAY
jgi:hypothetical protein